MAIACEMTWSYPNEKRCKQMEIRLKDSILTALRLNNRRVLDLKNSKEMKSSDKHLPLTYPDSKVNELCGPEPSLDTYQGVYRRFYSALLPYQHKETSPVHSPYWELTRGPLLIRPDLYLMGNNRHTSELRNRFLVALNMVVLKLDDRKQIICNEYHI